MLVVILQLFKDIVKSFDNFLRIRSNLMLREEWKKFKQQSSLELNRGRKDTNIMLQYNSHSQQ